MGDYAEFREKEGVDDDNLASRFGSIFGQNHCASVTIKTEDKTAGENNA